MRATFVALGKANRFALTGKKGNKDYYKGTRASHPDGVGYRTGPNGVFLPSGKLGSYKIVDEKVRIFIGPGFKSATSTEFMNDQLRPFASSETPVLPPDENRRRLMKALSSLDRAERDEARGELEAIRVQTA